MRINLPFDYHMGIYFSHLSRRTGVSSKLYDDENLHILLWDFDNIPLSDVIDTLGAIQLEYELSSIYIVSSSKDKYHAYCFTARTFREVIHVLSYSEYIDIMYLVLGIVRGYFTLRISSRENDDFELVEILKSDIPENVSPLDVMTGEYLTSNKGE